MGLNLGTENVLIVASSQSIGEEEEDEGDINKVYIGTNPIDKIKYKRQKSSKSYNQLLLEMFQGDIAPKEGQDSRAERALPVLPEGQETEQVVEPATRTQSDLSMGSLNLDII